LNPNLSPALERVVCRCLEKRPDDRFQSAKDLAFAIENVSALPTSARRRVSSAGARDERFPWQRVVPLAVAALAILLVADGQRGIRRAGAVQTERAAR